MKQFDAIILGFGKGGKTLAGALAASGKKVALIERSKEMYGGTCINVGCIPSKSLVHSALAAKQQKDASFEEKAAAYRAAINEKRRVTGMLRQKNYDKLASNPNASVFDGVGSFVDAHTVKVIGAEGEELLSAPQIFINTGSVSVVPKIEGIEGDPRVLFSDGMLDLDTLPERLVIIGGGYIGLEFASIYANFGSAVTVVQDGTDFVPREDRDVADELQAILEKKGVSFVFGAAITRLEQQGQATAVVYTKDGAEYRLPAEAVLVATGRRPNTDGLNLDAAGVKTTPRGAVEVNEYLQSSAEHIYAMGDVAGGLQFTYISLDDFRIVKNHLSGGSRSTATRTDVPYSVFLDPPFSRVGMTEAEARQAGYDVKVAKLPTAAIPKAQVLRETEGFLKAVVDAKTGKILGAALICPESHEMINTVMLAMQLGADYTVLRDQIFTHPTMSEALNDLFSLIG